MTDGTEYQDAIAKQFDDAEKAIHEHLTKDQTMHDESNGTAVEDTEASESQGEQIPRPVPKVIRNIYCKPRFVRKVPVQPCRPCHMKCRMQCTASCQGPRRCCCSPSKPACGEHSALTCIALGVLSAAAGICAYNALTPDCGKKRPRKSVKKYLNCTKGYCGDRYSCSDSTSDHASHADTIMSDSE